MPKTLPSTAVAVIQNFQARLGLGAPASAGRPLKIDINDDCAIILSTILSVINEIPDELIQVPTDIRVQLHAAVHDLSHHVSLLESQDVQSRLQHGWPTLRPMQWLDRLPALPANRYATEVICDVLKQCPDEVVPTGTRDLLFVSDQPLRDNIRRDIAAVDSALSNGEYKAATVLGGAAVEALLLWSLSGRSDQERQSFVAIARNSGKLNRQPKQEMNQWDLHEYIEVAAAGGLIKDETATIARIAKDYRNLIHPGRSQRLNQNCDRGTALAVVSTIEHVLNDLSASG